VEAAVADGRVHDPASLEAFARGRLLTAGLVDAALAAATVVGVHRATTGDTVVGTADGTVVAAAIAPSDCAPSSDRAPSDRGAASDRALAVLRSLDDEADARLLAPPLRAASRRLGRQLVRVAARCWPSVLLAGVVDGFPAGAHQAVATGAVGVAAGLDAAQVAQLVVHHTVATPTQAAVKLLGLDPFEVVALQARLAPEAAEVVDRALAAAAGPVDDLPASGSPLIELAAVDHGRWDVRMFAT
jgi:urease accessory protein